MTANPKDDAGTEQSQAGFPPRLLIIGAQKAGTTTLAYLLAQHPDIALGSKKETDFYTKNWHQGFDWYRSLYDTKDPASWLIDASPAYSGAYTDPATGEWFAVPQRIKEHVPAPKVFYILRCPVARAYSAYWHNARYGDERRSLREVLTSEPNYREQSFYDDQIAFYEAHLGAGSVNILYLEDLKTNPQGVVDSVLKALELPAMVLKARAQSDKKNAGFQYSGPAKLAMKLFPSDAHFRNFASTLKDKAPDALVRMSTALMTKDIPPLSEEDAKWMAPMFEEATQRLEKRLNKDLSHWIRAS